MGDDYRVALTLAELCDVNRLLGFPEEGIQQAKEGLEIFERLGDTVRQGECFENLAWAFHKGGQFSAAEEAAIRGNDLLQEKGQEYLLCRSHRLLGRIHLSKGERKKSSYHFKVALAIASPFNWHDEQFWIHYSLADLFLDEHRFDDAHAHIEQAKSHAIDNTYSLGRAMELKAEIWYAQGRLEDATSEVLRALETYEKFGASEDVGDCRALLRRIKRAMRS